MTFLILLITLLVLGSNLSIVFEYPEYIALKQIQLIGNLSNTRVYEYDEEDIKKIFKTLKEEISLAEAKFKSKGRDRNFKF